MEKQARVFLGFCVSGEPLLENYVTISFDQTTGDRHVSIIGSTVFSSFSSPRELASYICLDGKFLVHTFGPENLNIIESEFSYIKRQCLNNVNTPHSDVPTQDPVYVDDARAEDEAFLHVHATLT